MIQILPETPLRGVAVFTVHNRKLKTEAFLRSLHTQLPCGLELDIVLTDDGSSDGTADMVRHEAPAATIVAGTGNLFWAGGMRAALAVAMLSGADLLFLFNDDVKLDNDCVRRLVEAWRNCGDPRAIIVGSLRDPHTGAINYGGFRCASANRLRLERKLPGAAGLTPVDTFNANVVLVPTETMRLLDGLEPRFTHGFADIDLGFRARDQGIPVYLAPGTVGTCESNDRSLVTAAAQLGPRAYWKKVLSPIYFPWPEWVLMVRRHGGLFWPVSALKPYVRAIASYASVRFGLTSAP